jgi:hypothetical protein
VDDALALEAKVNIARTLEGPVRSVERLREHWSLSRCPVPSGLEIRVTAKQ